MRLNKNYLLKLLVLIAIYFYTAKFGLSISAVSGFATLIWFPTGISLSALLIFGRSLWPAIFLGAFFVNFTEGAPFLAALGIGSGNTLEALVAFFLLRKFGFESNLRRLKDALLLIFAGAFFSTFISALIGTSSLYFLSAAIPDFAQYLRTFFAWWIGDGLSNLVITPFLLALFSKHNFRVHFKSPLKLFEYLSLLFLVILTSLIVFRGQFGIFPKNLPIGYLAPPFIIWASLSFTLLEAYAVLLLMCTIAVWGIIDGLGPFASTSRLQGLLVLQGFVGVWSAISLILSTVISERKELEGRKDDFISMASHELKTPVTSLKLYAQLLGKEFGKSKSNKKIITLLSKFIFQIDKLDLLVSDLLDLSKINLNKFETRKELFDLNSLVKEVIKTTQPDLKDHKVQVLGKVKKEVLADRNRIGQVLTNLLTNAAKYSPNDKRIKIALKENEKIIAVSVRDFGIGINKEQQNKIFERFYRVRESFQTTFPGLGIGLYISSVIIKSHEGSIFVKSKPNFGSTFTFTLPKNLS